MRARTALLHSSPPEELSAHGQQLTAPCCRSGHLRRLQRSLSLWSSRAPAETPRQPDKQWSDTRTALRAPRHGLPRQRPSHGRAPRPPRSDQGQLGPVKALRRGDAGAGRDGPKPRSFTRGAAPLPVDTVTTAAPSPARTHQHRSLRRAHHGRRHPIPSPAPTSPIGCLPRVQPRPRPPLLAVHQHPAPPHSLYWL